MPIAGGISCPALRSGNTSGCTVVFSAFITGSRLNTIKRRHPHPVPLLPHAPNEYVTLLSILHQSGEVKDVKRIVGQHGFAEFFRREHGPYVARRAGHERDIEGQVGGLFPFSVTRLRTERDTADGQNAALDQKAVFIVEQFPGEVREDGGTARVRL